MEKIRFEDMALSPAIQKAIKAIEWEEASPIQSATIPLLMEGKDIIGQAQTGTGKTAAFAIPIIEKLDASRTVQAIVLCPTRELVVQVTEEFRKLLKFINPDTVVAIYGGQEIERQLRTLRTNPKIVVGTPGRTMDHMRRKTISLDSIKMIVLDEADEMLNMGFREDIEVILKDTPADRQTAMFSATMSPDILRLTKLYQKDPSHINVGVHKENTPKITQSYYEIPERAKVDTLTRLVDIHEVKRALVFCNTKSHVDTLVEELKARGYFADGLHGDLSQRQRDRVMNGFRKGAIEILVATDVAGRGIDVTDVTAVFNYDLPRDDEDYIHRIGRTGRAGKLGQAFTFVVGREIYSLKRIERLNNLTITRKTVPTLDDLDASRIKGLSAKVSGIIEKSALAKYTSMVETLMGDNFSALDVAAALLKLSLDEKKDSGVNKIESTPYSDDRRPYSRPRYGASSGTGSSSSGGSSYGQRNFHRSSSRPAPQKRRPEGKNWK